MLEQARVAAGELSEAEEEQSVVGTMDAKLAFAVLQNHERNRRRTTNPSHLQRNDMGSALTRLEKALKRYAPNVGFAAEAGE